MGKGTFHYGSGEEKENAIGETALTAGQVVSFVCVESPIQLIYRSLAEQKKFGQHSSQIEIVNESFDHITVKVTQESSSFSMSSALDPGGSLCFDGRNPASRRVFQKTTNFDSNYLVTIKKGQQELKSEVASGQVLRVEGIQM